MFLHFKHCASTTETISIVRTFINEKNKYHLSFKSQTPFCLTKHSRFNYYSSKEASIHHPNPISTITSTSWRITERKRGIELGYQQTRGLSEVQIIWAFFGFWMLCHSKTPIFILSWPEKRITMGKMTRNLAESVELWFKNVNHNTW